MTTRAIRRFSDRPVADAEIATCLRAAQQAPSGGNVQPQQYLVITDPERKAVLGHWYKRAFDRYDASLGEPGEFRDDAARRSWERTRESVRGALAEYHQGGQGRHGGKHPTWPTGRASRIGRPSPTPWGCPTVSFGECRARGSVVAMVSPKSEPDPSTGIPCRSNRRFKRRNRCEHVI